MSSLDFQAFQHAFARHVRDPRQAPRPAGVAARRMAVYNELLFNNLGSFVDNCFPVARAMLGETRWRRLKRAFYRDWPQRSPWFRDIPREFVRYLGAAEARPALPGWLPELAHYEWAELAVDIMDCPTPAHDPAGDLLARPVVLNPARLDLAYAWPVHRIGPAYRPRKPQATQLVVFRDADQQVQFTALNPVSARLLALLPEAANGAAACRQIAAELQHPAPDQLLVHGAALLAELGRQGIILGSAP